MLKMAQQWIFAYSTDLKYGHTVWYSASMKQKPSFLTLQIFDTSVQPKTEGASEYTLICYNKQEKHSSV